MSKPAKSADAPCTIRTAVPADAAAIASIRAAASSVSSAPATLADATGRYAEFLAATPEPVLLAEADGGAVGFLAMRREGHAAAPGDHPLQLWQLYVMPPFHGCGVAAQLMAAAMSRARACNHDVAWLGVSEDNARAIAFYRKQGFRSAGTHAIGTHDHAHRDLVMVRAVD
jgi:ribosomal protein S18 acetylase RimI-like enzyme